MQSFASSFTPGLLSSCECILFPLEPLNSVDEELKQAQSLCFHDEDKGEDWDGRERRGKGREEKGGEERRTMMRAYKLKFLNMSRMGLQAIPKEDMLVISMVYLIPRGSPFKIVAYIIRF